MEWGLNPAVVTRVVSCLRSRSQAPAVRNPFPISSLHGPNVPLWAVLRPARSFLSALFGRALDPTSDRDELRQTMQAEGVREECTSVQACCRDGVLIHRRIMTIRECLFRRSVGFQTVSGLAWRGGAVRLCADSHPSWYWSRRRGRAASSFLRVPWRWIDDLQLYNAEGSA